jgi:hypothetical protein
LEFQIRRSSFDDADRLVAVRLRVTRRGDPFEPVALDELQVATPSASERQYQQIGEPCPPTGESA